MAYVQLVRSHMHVCNAVMIFAELENQESLAQRLLLYPKEWDEAGSGQQLLDTRMATSKRLLRDAAIQYKVMLQPVEPMIKLKSGRHYVSIRREAPTNIT